MNFFTEQNFWPNDLAEQIPYRMTILDGNNLSFLVLALLAEGGTFLLLLAAQVRWQNIPNIS